MWQDSDISGGKVRLKHSSTSGETIGASGLVPGEIVINTADAKFYYKRANGTVGYIPAQGVESINGATGVVTLNYLASGPIDSSGFSVAISNSSPGYGIQVYDSNTGAQSLISVGTVILEGLPTTDPAVAGHVWNDGGTLKVSAGA